MDTNEKRTLIAVFSHSGNSRAVAERIRDLRGGDLFEIRTTDPYPNDYQAVVERAGRELRSNFRPRLVERPDDLRAYEVVIVGYPNWWGTLPMAVAAFLESYDLSGRTVLPFCTHGGGGLGHSESDIAKLCPGADVLSGLAICGSGAGSVAVIESWLKASLGS